MTRNYLWTVDNPAPPTIIAKANMALVTPICRVDLLFRAFSDRTRLRILNLLRRGELCVCDLIAILEVPQAKVSRHLAYLRRAGLVRARKEGLWQHYSLTPASGAFHAKLLECLSCCLGDVPELKWDVEKLKAKGECETGCCG